MAQHAPRMSADEALELLKNGNENFAAAQLKQPVLTKDRMKELVQEHQPFAAILGCSDSRVPVEFIFDAGIKGDIFVIRNAGNILNSHVIGSLEYAVVYLGVRLVVILGHDECGAIKAAICEKDKSKYVRTIVAGINPALELAKTQKGNLVENTTKNNVVLGARGLLEKSDVLAQYAQSSGLKILPANYCLESGKVEFYE